MASETKRDLLVLGVASIIFFVATMILSTVGPIYDSPDETANAYFTNLFADQGRLYQYEPLNAVLGDVLYPRSVVSVDGRLLPGSFLGLPVLYGLLLRVFSSAALPFLTPLIATLALFAWYGTIRALFDRRVALVSALLLAAHPAWTYYTARGLLHNVLFTSLLIFAAWFLVARPFAWLRRVRQALLPDGMDAMCAGLAIGLALFVRSSELFWIAGAGLVAAFFLRKMVARRHLVLLCLSILLALTPMFFLNRSLYGSPIATGYTVTDGSEEVSYQTATPSSIDQLSAQAASFVLPFGIHPRTMWRHFMDYGIGMFWWIAFLAAIGIPLAFPHPSDRGERRQARWAYLFVFAGVSAWLVLFYGSWNVHDNPDPGAITIGNSYIRYWLPAFVMTTPFAALTLIKLCERPLTTFARRAAATMLAIVVLFLGVRVAFFSPGDGLVPERNILTAYAAVRSSVFAQTEPDAVIIVDRSDKLFFPDRLVRYPLRDEATYALMPRLALRVPLYYYGITFPETDMTYLNTRKLKDLGLFITLLQTYDQESLYRISFAP